MAEPRLSAAAARAKDLGLDFELLISQTSTVTGVHSFAADDGLEEEANADTNFHAAALLPQDKVTNLAVIACKNITKRSRFTICFNVL